MTPVMSLLLRFVREDDACQVIIHGYGLAGQHGD
jgi:hypothetical protein